MEHSFLIDRAPFLGMSRISRTRVKRTRPSLAWPTILIDNVDFVSSYKVIWRGFLACLILLL